MAAIVITNQSYPADTTKTFFLNSHMRNHSLQSMLSNVMPGFDIIIERSVISITQTYQCDPYWFHAHQNAHPTRKRYPFHSHTFGGQKSTFITELHQQLFQPNDMHDELLACTLFDPNNMNTRTNATASRHSAALLAGKRSVRTVKLDDMSFHALHFYRIIISSLPVK